MVRSFLLLACGGCLGLLTAGCGATADENAGTPANATNRAAPVAGPSERTVQSADPARAAAPLREFKPIRLGGAAPEANPRAGRGAADAGDPHSNPAFAALKDVQIVLGEWRGTTRRKFGDFNALETVRWKWDLLTDRSQPALVFEASDSPYFQHARLTYDADRQQFRMAATDKAGVERVYEGDYTVEPQLVPGDDPDQLERTFKLQLVQVSPADDRELVQVVFNLQSNNRYLLELYRRSGQRVVVHDTIANQRQGTSFALSDEGYGERTCIISEGLGTMTVTHGGRSYYVCCTGCKAAFEENPEFWLAKAAERAKAE